ncbi:ubiquitin-protein ligase [Lithospermum erythrorhizon]|uniref:Ubiquitin-protein ligase n=1 Tax=Lithospermum erythrorhizon TaxID=34254 RepID=A0AAV3RMK9_LITER
MEIALVIAGVLCFVAASISSAGGIGGGGLFIPILKIVAGFDLKKASSFSAFMVTGGSIANVVCNMVLMKRSKNGGHMLIDYDIALLSEPCILLGVTIGVILNVVFPEWLITVLFALFLAWCTTKTCNSGISYWKVESEVVRRSLCENGKDERSIEVPLLRENSKSKLLCVPWIKLGILIMIWVSFLLLNLLRGNKYGQGIIIMESCGVGYWIITSIQIPLAIIFTAWILCSGKILQPQGFIDQDVEGRAILTQLMFPVMALLAGVLGGVFGIGGGMLISPLLVQVGIPPEITAGTCSFMVFFSSTMSAIQYLLLGMEHFYNASIFAVICFAGSLIGLLVVQRAIERHGRASLIVFSVGLVMALSTVLITSFGAYDVWMDYTSGKYMGFKQPC